METELKMRVKLFGALRKYANAEGPASVEFDVPRSCDASELRNRLSRHLAATHPGFNDAGLLSECAVATESRVLQPDEIVPENETLAILPPVCGG